MPEDLAVLHLNVNTAEFAPLPEFGGAEAVLHRSPDGTRLAGSFHHSGSHTTTMEYDEFFYVVDGHATLTVHGGEKYELAVGDACYLRQGLTIDFDYSDDFHDVAVLMSDTPISY